MNLPRDPFLLLSVINTALRDKYTSFEALCEDIDFSAIASASTGTNAGSAYTCADDLKKALESAGFSYNPELNQFK